MIKRKIKRKGILFWNEKEDHSSIIIIKDNGVLEKLRPIKKTINKKFI